MNFFKSLVKAVREAKYMKTFSVQVDTKEIIIKDAEEVLHQMSKAMKAVLDHKDAENYIEWTLEASDTHEQYILTLQKGGHPTPNDLKVNAEEALEHLNRMFKICSKEEFAHREECKRLKEELAKVTSQRDEVEEILKEIDRREEDEECS